MRRIRFLGVCVVLFAAVCQAQPPQLDSRPGAKHTLLLDFDGHAEATWGQYQNIRSQKFDIDNDYQAFSPTEQVMISEIWERVSEDYIPFDINVTTVDRGGEQARIVIGGSTRDWYSGYQASGVAQLGGYFKPGWNKVGFVFSDMLYSFTGFGHYAWTKTIAESASHEAGHLFGLSHFPKRDAHGRFVSTYDRGDDARREAPIMGIGHYAAKTRWARATNDAGNVQDDLDLLETALGYAADDFADDAAGALPVLQVHNQFAIRGVLGKPGDVDRFHFRTRGGRVSLAITVQEKGSNLAAQLSLVNAQDEVVASTTTDKHAPPLVAELEPGVYYLLVDDPSGTYGNLGQYTIQGQVPSDNLQANAF